MLNEGQVSVLRPQVSGEPTSSTASPCLLRHISPSMPPSYLHLVAQNGQLSSTPFHSLAKPSSANLRLILSTASSAPLLLTSYKFLVAGSSTRLSYSPSSQESKNVIQCLTLSRDIVIIVYWMAGCLTGQDFKYLDVWWEIKRSRWGPEPKVIRLDWSGNKVAFDCILSYELIIILSEVSPGRYTLCSLDRGSIVYLFPLS